MVAVAPIPMLLHFPSSASTAYVHLGHRVHHALQHCSRPEHRPRPLTMPLRIHRATPPPAKDAGAVVSPALGAAGPGPHRAPAPPDA